MMDFLRRCLTLVVAASVALTIGAVASRAGTPTTRAARSGGTLSTASVAAPTRVLALDNQRRIDINNLNMFVNNYGGWAYDQATGNSGVVYPKGTNKTAVFASGLWLGATVDGSVRTEVGEYSWEYGPGRILSDPLANAHQAWEDVDSDGLVVFKVRRWTGDPEDSAHVERAVDASDGTATDPLVHHSWSEYMAGAVPRGAPWKMYRLPNTATVDVEDDSLDVPGPDVAGDQMLWSVYNDANPSWHTNDAGNSAPLGLQIRQTTFAFDRSGALGNTIFLKFEIIHPHLTTAADDVYTKTLEDMYVSLWADVDLGGSSDDLTGCDTTLSLGFTYNATNNDQTYGKTPPVVGYDFFLGPRTTGGDTLGMTSFNKYINGTDPGSSDATYSYMQGLQADGSDLVDPTTGLPTHYFNSGDPVLGTGWLDNNAADKRMMLSSGPFSMEPGDTQIVVAALIIGQGSNRLSSVAGLRFYDTYAQDAFDKAFDLPSPPSQPKVEVTADHGTATLCWDAASRTNYHVPGYAFEGYNVYQGETVAGPWKLLATYDEVDAIRVIYDEIFDLTTGQTIPAYPTAFGSDLGVAFCHTVTEDAIRGGSLKDGTNYYYAVTAYSYNPTGKPKVLETSQVPVTVMPQRPALGTDPGTASATDVTYTQLDPSQPPSTEVVSVQVVNPADVTGHGYRVTFEPMDPLFFGQIGADTATARYSWTLTDTTAGEVRLTGQLNQRGDVDYRVVDGIQVTVAGAYFPVLQTVSYQNTDATHYRALEGYTNWSGNQDWFYGAAGPAITYWPNSSRINPAADPDSFTTVRLVYTEPRQGQKAYRFFRRELADSTSAGDVGDEPPTGIGYVYGGFHRINLWAIDAVSGDTLDIAWCERMKTDSVGTYLPDDRQPSCQDSLWTPEPSTGDATLERLFVEKSRYSETDTMPKALYTGATNPGALRQGILPGLYMIWAAYRAAGDPADPMQDRIIDPGDAIRFTWAVPATSNDVYTFDTSPLVRGNAALARTGLGRIRVVPNPYYNRSTYELSQFNRMIRFINLPEQCTIRIFSLSGELIRTLRKTDATSSVFTWNVQTENGLPVASGVYVYHVDAPGVGSTYGRLVVFMEKERLNTY